MLGAAGSALGDSHVGPYPKLTSSARRRLTQPGRRRLAPTADFEPPRGQCSTNTIACLVRIGRVATTCPSSAYQPRSVRQAQIDELALGAFVQVDVQLVKALW